MVIQPPHRLNTVDGSAAVNGGTAERASSIAATLCTVVAIFGFIILLLAIAGFWYVSIIAAQIGTGIQRAFSSPEFQEQMVVFMVLYVIAAALIIAWNHFESLFEAADSVTQAAAAASSLFDCSISTF
jgi:hypothetical protein